MEKNNIKPVVKANAVAELLSKGVIRKQTFNTKYKDSTTGKSTQKQRLYFIGSVYSDTDVLTKSKIKDGVLIKKAIKHKSHGKEADYPTNFATLFNFDNQGDVIIQQPYNGSPSIFGIMYKDYHTLFYGKKDSYGEKEVKHIKQLQNNEYNECGKIVGTEKTKLYFGKKLNKENDYLQRFDNYEQRIRKAIALTKEKLKINDIFNESKQEEIKKELLDNFNLQYKNKKNDNDFYLIDIDKTNKILEIGSKKGFYCTFSVEKDAIIEKSGFMNCNEFVSISDEKVASTFFFCDGNSLEDFFDPYYGGSSLYLRIVCRAEQKAEEKQKYINKENKQTFGETEWEKFCDIFYEQYDENFRNLLNGQKKLGLPYIPILYKNDKVGFRLENMKLSVFAEKINDGFIANGQKPLFSEAEIQEFEKFENQFVFEGEKQEMQQDNESEKNTIKLQNKDNNISYDDEDITINNDTIKLQNKDNNILNNEIDCKCGKTVKIKTSSAETGQGQSLWDRLKSKCCCCFGGNENEIINTVNVNPSQLAIENKI